MTPPINTAGLRISNSGREISPKITSQSDLKIQEVGQKIRDIAEKIVQSIQNNDYRASTWITIHSCVGQLQQKAKIAKKISKDEPKYKQYREAYISTICLEYRNASERITQAYNPNATLESWTFKEVKEILEKINNLV